MGRHHKGDRKPVMTRIPKDLHQELEAYADFLGLSLSETVQMAIQNMLEMARWWGRDSPMNAPWKEEMVEAYWESLKEKGENSDS